MKVGYSKPVTSWLTVVGTMDVTYRETHFSWENDPWSYRPKNMLQEVVLAPGVALVLPNIFRDGLTCVSNILTNIPTAMSTMVRLTRSFSVPASPFIASRVCSAKVGRLLRSEHAPSG